MTELMDGLILHEGVVSAEQQREILDFVADQLAAGRAGTAEAKTKTYTAPPETWLRTGQGREMLQYGAFTKCNKVVPARVLPLPQLLEALLDTLQAARVFEPCERPDTCVVNVYAPGSWIPPHVDSEAFERPFCTVSLVSAQQVVFGDAISGEHGDWDGPLRFEMGVGSVLRVGGLAAGPTCRHALPRATSQRISLTFRRLGRETRDRFEAIRAASAEAASARAERRRQAKAARGRVAAGGDACRLRATREGGANASDADDGEESGSSPAPAPSWDVFDLVDDDQAVDRDVLAGGADGRGAVETLDDVT